MYGRDTSVGYQKSILTGSLSRPLLPAICLALAGSYVYVATSSA